MVLIEPNGRPHVACTKCRQNIVWPQSLTAEDKGVLAALRRLDAWECAKLAHSKFGLDLREAKALVFHITIEPGKCHRCSAPTVVEIGICPNCRSANLDW